MERENTSPLAAATALPVVPVRQDAPVIAPDVRVEVRREGTGETFVSRLHRLDFQSIPVLMEAVVMRATPFDAAPLDHDAGLRPVMTITMLATDDGWQAAMATAAALMGAME